MPGAATCPVGIVARWRHRHVCEHDLMGIEDENEPLDTRRMVLQTAVAVAAAGVLLWLVNGGGVKQISAFVDPSKTSLASVPLPLTARVGACQPSQLEITGFMTACADTVIEAPLDCLADAAGGVFNGLAHVQDRRHHYVMAVSLGGGYRGAGTYALTEWDMFRESPRDGQSKVTLQQDQGSSRWRSAVGSLTINPGEKSGSVLADLYPVDEGPGALRRIRVDGPWACSVGGGGSASFTSAISR